MVIFLCVERALVFCVIFFCAWNALWHYCVVFSAHGTRSSVIVSYFPRVEVPNVERALALLCYIIRVWRARAWNTLWSYCVISSARGGPACGTRSDVIVLYFTRVKHALALLCYIFLRVKHALALLCYFFCACNTLWYFVFN